MELLIEFIVICVLGALLYTAFWIYTKIEKIIKQYRKIFVAILLACYASIFVCAFLFDVIQVSDIFAIIFFSGVGLFSFFLTWCLIFSLNKKE